MANNDLTAAGASGLRAWPARGRLGIGEGIYEGVRRLSAKWCAKPSVHGGKRRPEGTRLAVNCWFLRVLTIEPFVPRMLTEALYDTPWPVAQT